MSKKKFKHSIQEEERNAKSLPLHDGAEQAKPAQESPKWLPYFILFLFGTLLYLNTIKNDYAVDDTLVVTQNKFTQQGFEGLSKIFTTDAFEGFFGEKARC